MVECNTIPELWRQELLQEIEMRHRDVLKEEHYPIAIVLSMRSVLERAIDVLCAGNDYYEEVYSFEFTCNFPENVRAEFQDIIPDHDGLLITCDVYDGFCPVTLTYEELYYYMKLYANRYVASHPDKKEKLESCLAAYRKRFLHATE